MPRFSDKEKEMLRQKLMKEGERLFLLLLPEQRAALICTLPEFADQDVAGNGCFLSANRPLPPRELCDRAAFYC